MNRHGKNAAITLLALTLGILGLAPAFAVERGNRGDLWIHIHVRDSSEGDVSVNLPISVVETMARALPAAARGEAKIRFEEEDISVAELRQIWQELRRHPDATFITVDEVDSKVRVAKQGGHLVVRAHETTRGRGEQVEMKIPGTVVDALLSAPGEELNIAAALQALARHGEGELVTVSGAGETVRIWIDDRSDSRTR